MKRIDSPGGFAAAVLAAGALVPGFAEAQVIPLGDPSFEDYVVPPPPTGFNYAYSNLYRPTSAWVDDLDHFGAGGSPYVQDDGSSNWLYNSTYAELATVSRRGSPRTGNQAMHGFAHYNAQETGAVFEAGRTYTFSLWAQHDVVFDGLNGVFMYIFDGSVPFSDANSLATQLFTTQIPQRSAAMTAVQSQANWGQISVNHTVAPGAPEIGHPVGVGFFLRQDTAVDDASLSSIPEPATAAALAGIGGTLLLMRRRHEAHGP